MSKLTATEYRKMLARVEAELAYELKRSPWERDSAHVDECVETLVFIRERLNRLETRSPEEAAPVKHRPSGGKRLKRIAIIAAIVAALIVCGIAVAEALGFRFANLLFKVSPNGLQIIDEPPALGMSKGIEPGGALGTPLLSVAEAEDEDRSCSLQQLHDTIGSRLIYPIDTAGFLLESVRFMPSGRDGGEVTLHLVKEGRRVTVIQNYYNDFYRPENHAAVVNLYDSFDEVIVKKGCGHEYAVAEGMGMSAAAFGLESMSCLIYGQADIGELEALVVSMLQYAEGSIDWNAALSDGLLTEQDEDHLRFSILFSL